MSGQRQGSRVKSCTCVVKADVARCMIGHSIIIGCAGRPEHGQTRKRTHGLTWCHTPVQTCSNTEKDLFLRLRWFRQRVQTMRVNWFSSKLYVYLSILQPFFFCERSEIESWYLPGACSHTAAGCGGVCDFWPSSLLRKDPLPTQRQSPWLGFCRWDLL